MANLYNVQFAKVYEEHADAIFRYCYFKLSDRDRALDLLQDTFVKVWQYMCNGHNVENVKALLYMTARNLIIDEYRKKKMSSLEKLQEEGWEPVEEGYVDSLVNRLDSLRAVEFIQKIPDKYRDVIFMRYVQDLSIKEIASLVGESENAVSVRIHRGLAKLKSLFAL